MHDLRIAELSSAAADDAVNAALRHLEHANIGEVRLDQHDRMLYATDASIYQVEPLAVVFPRTVDDLGRAVKLCAEHGLPVLCRGGGTSLAGQAVNRAVVLDTSRHLTGIDAIDVERRCVRVQPGAILNALNAAAGKHGLMFGPDVATASHATLGGMIGNNSAGAHSILYGHTAAHVIAIDALLADGTPVRFFEGAGDRHELVRDLTERVAAVVRPIAGLIRERFPKTLRHVSGYNLHTLLDQIERSSPGSFDHVNLSQLMCGAEGTLAVVTSAELNLVERAKCVGLAVIAMDSLEAALEAVPTILETQPAAVELLDDMVLELAPGNLDCKAALELLNRATGARNPGAILYVEFFGHEDAELAASLQALRDRLPGRAIAWLTDAADMAIAWGLRKAGEPLLHSIPGSRKPISFIEDTAVDPARLAEYVRAMRTMIESYGTRAAFYAHASVGCLHIRPMLDLHIAQDVEHMERIATDVARMVRSFGGTLSGEHGDGRVRSPLLAEYFGEGIIEAFRQIKSIFDPDNRLNPGNIANPGGMQEHLRTKPEKTFVNVPGVRTFFRYEHEHGFGAAVEMCNGAGVCRKRDGGTMCPSYRATLDERHATRGRGNALRLAITGQMSGVNRPEFGDPDTLETLRLCLSCKACKRECPSNVDIARLKAEYLAQSYARRGGAPLSVRALGNVRQAARLASFAPGLANRLSRLTMARTLMQRVLGIDRRRSLPSAAPSLFRWMEKREHERMGDKATVILFADCFTTYSEPHIGKAAVAVLEAMGYRAIVPDVGCCGRAMISVGMLAEGVRTCSASATKLHAVMDQERAVAIVGCEPSCVSAICDDWRDLNLSIAPERVNEVADRTMLVEQFVDAHWNERAPAHCTPSGKSVLLHAHCHQKALWGAESSSRALARVASDVKTPDTGCCGMAGSFGFTTDRYDLSMKIGELSLFPAVRNNPDAVIAAPGTSCRHQLRDALGVDALHPVELIAKQIGAE